MIYRVALFPVKSFHIEKGMVLLVVMAVVVRVVVIKRFFEEASARVEHTMLLKLLPGKKFKRMSRR